MIIVYDADGQLRIFNGGRSVVTQAGPTVTTIYSDTVHFIIDASPKTIVSALYHERVGEIVAIHKDEVWVRERGAWKLMGSSAHSNFPPNMLREM